MRANCLHVVVAAALTVLFTTSAAAQVGRVNGLVKDDSGNPIKGATVTAENPNIGPTTYTASTDDKGRFTIIGLRAGQWRFSAQAPGHSGDVGELSVRFGSPNPALAFTLRKNGPLPTAPLGSVTARDLQGAACRGRRVLQAAAMGRGDRRVQGDRQQDAGAQRHQPADCRGVPEQEGLRQRARRLQALLATDPANEKAKVGIAAVSLEQGDAAKAEATLSAAAQTRDRGARHLLQPRGDQVVEGRRRPRPRGCTARRLTPIPRGASRATSSACSR